MTSTRTTATGDRIIEPMIALAGCSKQHRIVVAGSRGVELMLELHRRKTLETALDWLVELLSPTGMLVVWVDPQKPAATENLRLSLEARGFAIEAGTVHECGCAVSARRSDMHPLRKAA
jgi:hypothetical protein